MRLLKSAVQFFLRLWSADTPANPPLPEFQPVARQPRRIHANAIKWEI